MSFVAAAMIKAWNSKKHAGDGGLICVCFDQRNHGSRMIDNKANESWNGGNPTHGPDMYSLFTGTAQDVSQLISLLPAYLPFRPTNHICGGVSLGAHATWHATLHDERITAAIIIIGCADYTRRSAASSLHAQQPILPAATFSVPKTSLLHFSR
jgi:pimeloyl-ACP methyl ester carboxylesterase